MIRVLVRGLTEDRCGMFVWNHLEFLLAGMVGRCFSISILIMYWARLRTAFDKNGLSRLARLPKSKVKNGQALRLFRKLSVRWPLPLTYSRTDIKGHAGIITFIF